MTDITNHIFSLLFSTWHTQKRPKQTLPSVSVGTSLSICLMTYSYRKMKMSRRLLMAWIFPSTMSTPRMCDKLSFMTSADRTSTTNWQLEISSSRVTGCRTMSEKPCVMEQLGLSIQMISTDVLLRGTQQIKQSYSKSNYIHIHNCYNRTCIPENGSARFVLPFFDKKKKNYFFPVQNTHKPMFLLSVIITTHFPGHVVVRAKTRAIFMFTEIARARETWMSMMVLQVLLF